MLTFRQICAEQEKSNELVAEFMLLANMSVAQLIGLAFPDNALLRRHPTPQDRQLGELEASAQKLVKPIGSKTVFCISQGYYQTFSALFFPGEFAGINELQGTWK